jgi:hypothetical protein
MGAFYRVWVAVPAGDGCNWLPWEPVAPASDWPRWLSHDEAHGMAQRLRLALPCHLLAVRRAGAGEPVYPAAMADHYDLPPYSEQ